MRRTRRRVPVVLRGGGEHLLRAVEEHGLGNLKIPEAVCVESLGSSHPLAQSLGGRRGTPSVKAALRVEALAQDQRADAVGHRGARAAS